MKKFFFAACAGLCVQFASAHISFTEPQQVNSKQNFTAVFKVPHGCGGAATTAIRISMPEGVLAVKPQAKAGWRIDKEHGAYTHSYDYRGKTHSSGIKTLVWHGGSLADDEFDTFAFSAYLSETAPKQNGKLVFPVTQICGDKEIKWDMPSGAYPAPYLPVGTAAPHGEHHHH